MSFAVRNLENLRTSGSTARVLNLLSVWETWGGKENHGQNDPEWSRKPMFRTPILNRALIIKHRLRRNEDEYFSTRRHVATKIVVPISVDDLRTGGHFLFVDQIGYKQAMMDAFGLPQDHPDLHTLQVIDSLPSLDPFLLREQLKRHGLEPAACYFSIAEGDMARMAEFVQREIAPLITLSLGSSVVAISHDAVRQLTEKILGGKPGSELQSLREALRLQPHEYQEGIFCWKGFLYYKWLLTSLLKDVGDVATAVQITKPIGRAEGSAKEFLKRGRGVLTSRIMKTCDEVQRTISIYDGAYASLKGGDPGQFREFLLAAPDMFSRLGEQLGSVQHVVSFWKYRFGRGQPRVSVEELMDIFMDFEGSLGIDVD